MIYNTLFVASALVAAANAHGVILAAQGTSGTPASIGFGVDSSIPRNCTTISPCQLDTTIIRDAEITANIANSCGRTELTGNIDVGENTENALAANQVTSVTKGSSLQVTIHQVNADGAGPYTCDLDETSNSAVSFKNLTVTNNIPGANGLSQAKEQDFNITVTLPTDLACTGGSTGNICTIRCRNNAVAGPFGGCIAVKQTDVTAKVNTASNIATAQTLKGVQAQVLQNAKDLPAAVEAIANAGSNSALANASAANKLLAASVTTKASTVQTPAAALGNNAAAATTTAAAASTTKASKATTTKKNSKATSAAKSNKNNNNNANNKREDQSGSSLPGHLRWGKRVDSDSA